MLRRLLAVTLAVVLLSLPGVAVANAAAADLQPQIKYTAPYAVIHAGDPDTVTVAGVYRCKGPAEAFHLWVSVKQGGPDPTAEGSSSTVDAWYDTNISGDTKVICDGKWQVAVVDLGAWAQDFTGRPLGELENGKGWLQFCLVQGGESDPENVIVASSSRWLKVVTAG